METTWFTIIKVTSIVFAGMFLILGAVFGFLEILQEGKNDKARKWFERKWIVIRASSLLGLPERVIGWALNVRSFLQKWICKRIDGIAKCIDWYILLPVLLSLWIIIGIWILYRHIEVCIYLASATLFLVFWIIFICKGLLWIDNLKISNWFMNILFVSVFVFFNLIANIILFILFMIGPLVGSVVWLVLLLKINIVVAALVALAIIPLYALAFFLTLISAIQISKMTLGTEDFSDKRKNLLTVFTIGVSGSFAVTLGSLGLGHMMSPMAWVPQTVQMLFLNILCDGLTLVVTFWLLRWAVAKKAMFRIPTAIVVNIMIIN